jgi:hypothetical protein
MNIHVFYFYLQVIGQRLAYKFVNPPITDKTTKIFSAHASVTKTEEKAKTDNQIIRKTNPEIRQNIFHVAMNPMQSQFSFPTLPNTALGLQLIQSPLRMPQHNHMTYPTYQYVIPFVHPSVCPCH